MILSSCTSGEPSRAQYLLALARRTRIYDRGAAEQFLSAAQGSTSDAWGDRCLAVLLLENQLLRIPMELHDEFDRILSELGVKGDLARSSPMNDSVAGQRYGAGGVQACIGELLRRMRRLDRVHRLLQEEVFEEDALKQVLRVSREAPKLTLARYAFTPDDVVREILRQLNIGRGTEDGLARLGTREGSCRQDRFEGPSFESAIVKKLCANRHTYWVSERCGSELNALVEYPLASAVVVIKLPGSELEIEVKRAGIRGDRLMNVITRREGRSAPTSHRLFGGSLGWLAQREAEAAAIFSRIFHLVHNCEAPCSRTVQRNSIVSIPTSDGDTHVVDYLTDERYIGPGFEETQEAIKACVEGFPSDTGVAAGGYHGNTGLTLQFIGQALPQQAILAGSSSYRFDRILLYLSDDGPEAYFRTGLQRDYERADKEWLAVTVLEEILGEVNTEGVTCTDYVQFVRTLFAIPANRARADRNFLAVARQIGESWGTLLAFRGFSDGESFVLRNVGLRSVWRNGGWEIQFLMMDHDDLTVAGSRYKHLWPWRELSGMTFDAIHIFGGKMGDEWIPGEMGVLRQIFHVDPAVAAAGEEALQRAARRAHRKAQQEIETNENLRALFNENFLRGYRDFNDLEASYPRSNPDQLGPWKLQAGECLRRKGHDEDLVAETIRAVCHFRELFEYAAFLYDR